MESGKEGESITEVPELDEKDEDDATGEDNKRIRASTTSARRLSSGVGGSTQRNCQVEDCTAEMSSAKPYHRRHKACEFHAKAAVVLLAGLRQRFCQQCSRFHEISEFDEAKRSCRGVWQDTMRGATRAYAILNERRCIELKPFLELI